MTGSLTPPGSVQVRIHCELDTRDKSSYKPNMRMLINLILIAVLPMSAAIKLNASPEDDAKTVAALDTQYQAAVKANDVTTMDQDFLADDFVPW